MGGRNRRHCVLRCVGYARSNVSGSEPAGAPNQAADQRCSAVGVAARYEIPPASAMRFGGRPFCHPSRTPCCRTGRVLTPMIGAGVPVASVPLTQLSERSTAGIP